MDKKKFNGDYVIKFGSKYRGKKVKDLPKQELENYIHWLSVSYSVDGSYMNSKTKELAEAYIQHYVVNK